MSLGCFRTLAAFAVTLGLATHAFAAPGDGEKKPGGPGGPGREAMIKKFDKNGDGKLDQDEMKAAREAMGDRKPGGSGAPGGGKPGEGGRPSPEQMKEIMKKFDKNGDGKLDDAEKAAARESFAKMRGGAGGKPGEGKPGAGKPGEGGPSREAMIKKFDKNGDGKLDDGEKAAAKEAFEKMRAAGGKPGEGKKPDGKKPGEKKPE